MTSFILKAAAVLSYMLSLIIKAMAINLALSVLCPPLAPFSLFIATFTSIFILSRESSLIDRKNTQDINSYQNNDGRVSFLSALWSSISAGLSKGLVAPSIKAFDALTGRAPISSLKHSFWSENDNQADHNNVPGAAPRASQYVSPIF